jgi:RNA polymerase sigma factor (sigma-70 family)
MNNPFSTKDAAQGKKDELLVARAQQGNHGALEQLIRRHQPWIYNIALRMVMSPHDAEDITQEALIKIITNLAGFRGRSQFRTWAYRIVANHVINMKKRRAEFSFTSFARYGQGIDRTPDLDIPDPRAIPADLPVIYEEVKTHCMMGMMLCLDRKQRLAFIFGELFNVTDIPASDIMGVSRAAYRQMLSRARRHVFNFVQEKCGHINPDNPCRCHKKAQAMIQGRAIDPSCLDYNRDFVHYVKDVCADKRQRLNSILDQRSRELFGDQPFINPPDFAMKVHNLLESGEMKDIFDL